MAIRMDGNQEAPPVLPSPTPYPPASPGWKEGAYNTLAESYGGEKDADSFGCDGVEESLEVCVESWENEPLSVQCRSELKVLLSYSWPVTLAYLMEILPGMIGLSVVGHLDDPLLIDATALGTMFTNVTCLSIGMGMATALDTLCSQAFGAGEAMMGGRWWLRGTVILMLMFVPLAVLTFFSAPILEFLGQRHDVSVRAQRFAMLALPGIPCVYIYETTKKVLQSQNVFYPLFAMLCIVLVFHTPLSYLGAAVATSAGNFVSCLLALEYTWWWRRAQLRKKKKIVDSESLIARDMFADFWPGLHVRDLFSGWGQFFMLGIPGMLQMCLEWWCFEILAILSGLLPDPKTAIGAHTILFYLSAMTYMVYFGISDASAIRIGNLLGAGKSQVARLSAYIALGITLSTSIVFAVLVYFLMGDLTRIFIDNDKIIAVTKSCALAVGSYQFFDAMTSITGGIFRGCGRQWLGAIIILLTYYPVGLTAAYLLGFLADWRVKGLWWAMAIALFLSGGAGLLYVLRTDWGKQARKAFDRLKQEKIDNPSVRGQGETAPLLAA
eukprot:CAMPEP_0177641738 /NCGR_PEP_ID=MMETSP0447-20121125/7221_1 /TAXON_ID=0 /ORGANISM="Stygamoeba regulata, Strain BSH-02190019" /LENGTH=552 /DNA_ID=CAMNT_0019143865 /DNA_START=101 /DNA_END=1759 /DNA_ORIENTATION=-